MSVVSRNIFWNLLGYGLPLIAALFSIPALISALGTDRFGTLMLIWAVISYFGYFDIGVGRAMTQRIAAAIGRGDSNGADVDATTGVGMTFLLGVVTAVVAWAISDWLVYSVLEIPAELQAETVQAFRIIGLSLPLVIGTTGLRGVIEAHGRFVALNWLRVPMGIYTFVAPLAVTIWTTSLSMVAAVLVLGRLVGFVAHWILCIQSVPRMMKSPRFDRARVRVLITTGGWMTVSSVVNPLMATIDRFFVGAYLSVDEVTYYATPYEAVTKLWHIPSAITGVLFPAFATQLAQDRPKAVRLFKQSYDFSIMVLFPLCLILIVFAGPMLGLWIGPQFMMKSTAVFQWLAIGVFLSSLGSLPFALVQAAGHPHLTAGLNLLELPLYTVALWIVVGIHGIEGVALVWSFRMAVDTLALMGLSSVVVRELTGSIARPLLWTIGCAAALILPIVSSFFNSGLGVAMILILFGIASWLVLLDSKERSLLLRVLRPGLSGSS